MDLTATALPLFTVVFVIAAVVVPILRLKRLTGRSGYVADRPPTPVHHVAVEGFRVATVGLLAWPFLVRALGTEALTVWSAPPIVGAIGWACSAAALGLVIVAQTNMGRSWRMGIDAEERTELVTGGLFRFVRNPIFSGILLMVLGVVLVTPSPWTVMAWVFLAFVVAVQARLEEEHLLRQHGAGYRAYAARVGRFVPLVGKLDGGFSIS